MSDARRLGQPTGLALALYAKGYVPGWIGDESDVATAALEESIALTRAGASDAVFAQALNSLAIHHSRLGQHAEALAELRESIDHSTRSDLVANLTAMGFASIVFARAGSDDAAAVCAGSASNGFLTAAHSLARLPGSDTVVPALERRLGPQRWREATERGAAMDYDELLAFVIERVGRRVEAQRRLAQPGCALAASVSRGDPLITATGCCRRAGSRCRRTGRRSTPIAH